MSKPKHILRMIVGFVLYWLIGMAMPASWWMTKRGWFHWALPVFGYYAYHPYELKWYELMKVEAQ